MSRVFLTIIISLLLVSVSLAGGFGLYEFGAAASALGGAVVANPMDASTIFYNPAGMAFLNGNQFYGGVTFITASNKWTGAAPIFTGQEHESKAALHYPIGFYYAHQINEDFSAGIGLTNPFGLGLAWEDDFPGRGISKDVDLKSFYFSPVVSYKVMDGLSVSGGLDLVISTVYLERSAYLFDSEGSPGIEAANSKLEATSELGIGFTFSALYKTEKLGIGFLYRHSVENKFSDGEATFDIYDTYAAGTASALLVDQTGKTSMTFPSFFSIGAHYMVLDKLGIEVDYMYYNWSVFDELVLEFDDPRLNQVVPEDYENSGQIRIGAHYDLTDALQVRVGYINDKSPQPLHSVSPLLPDSDKNDYSIGLGYKTGNMKFDAGYMLVDFGERSTVEDGVGKNENGFDGTYASVANLFFFSFGYEFD